MIAPDITNLTDLNPLHSGPPDTSSPCRATGLFTAKMADSTGDDEALTTALVKVWDALDADSRDRFQREWRFVGILDGHPGVAEVHDGGTEGNRVWLVRDHVSGVSLAEEIAGPAPTTAGEVADRVSHHLNVAKIIAYAHRNGVSHGALKPTNVFRSDSGQAIVTDFGLPGVTDHTSVDRSDPTIAPWLAPEVGVAGRPSPPADVYALGSMLFAALTGRAPTGTPADETALRDLPGIGVQLVPVIAAAMATDPRHRPLNAGIYGQALARFDPATAAPTAQATPADVPMTPSPSRPSLAPSGERASTPARAPERTAEPRQVPGFSRPPRPEVSDERRRSRRTTILAGVGLAAAAILIAGAWSFLVDLTRSEPTSPVETASAVTGEPLLGDDSNTDDASESGASDSAISDSASTDSSDDPRASSTSVAQSGAPASDPADAATAEASADDRGDSTNTDADLAADEADDADAQAVEADPAPTQVRPEPTTAPIRPAPTPAPAVPVPTLESTQEPIVAPTPDAQPDADVGVDYQGARFTAALPDGWVPVSENRDVGYGYRTRFKGPENDFLYIDLTPPTHHDGSETIEQSARRIAAQTATAGPVVKLTIDDKTTWWFEYTGDDGSARIDVFFAIDDTGYAVVGGSKDDPKAAYEALIEFVRTLRQV